MTHPIRFVQVLVVALIAVGCLGMGAVDSHAQTEEYEVDGKIFGMAEAEVFEEDYDGPPVVGQTLTQHPKLAPLAYEGNKTHRVRIDVVAQEIEVAPGVRYTAWTFGGSVPGPVLHVREGDRVVFTMKNRSDEAVDVTKPGRQPTASASGLPASGSSNPSAAASPFMHQLAERDYQNAEPAVMPMPHSMDFHAGTVAEDDKWRTIGPGQSIRFEWVANYPGQYMYHCGTPPVLQHVAMGQYGMVVVSPKDGYPTDEKVDRVYTVTQSEFYLRETDGSEELHTMDMEGAMSKDPKLVVFNGHRDALTEKPLKAHPGERVRIHFLNAGPSLTSSVHLIGGILDRVYYEGHPKNERFGMQTVLLGASNGAVIEFIAPEEGEYTLVNHQFADAARGATGTLVVEPEE